MTEMTRRRHTARGRHAAALVRRQPPAVYDPRWDSRDRSPFAFDRPRISRTDWIEFVLVSAVVWFAVLRPPLPGVDW